MKVRLLERSKAILGEGPLWDWRSNTLYWVDILGDKLHVIKGEVHTEFPAPKLISALGLTERTGELLAAAGHELYLWEGNHFVRLSRLEASEEVRFNDGKCSPWGDFWVGTMDLEESRDMGALFRFDGVQFHTLTRGLTISNGLDWFKDSFFLVDSPKRKVFAFKWNGELLELQGIAVDTSSLPGVPDGMTIDSTGLIWVAHYGGGIISVWEPFSDRPAEVIKLPVQIITSLTFGGEDLRQVFVTSSSRGGEEEGGSVFTFEAETKGRNPFLCYRIRLPREL